MQARYRSTAALIPLGAALEQSSERVVTAEAARARAAEAEALYRDWLEISSERIAGEQLLLNGYALAAVDQGAAGERDLFVVLAYFDAMHGQLFTRRVDVGEVSNYIGADARKWRALLRALRRASTAARDTARYETLTRALAAIEFLASAPIADAVRRAFELTNVVAEPAANGVRISGDVRSRTTEPSPVPNIAVCLRDSDGNVCGEAVLAPPVAEMHGHKVEPFAIVVEADSAVADIEVMFTRRAVADGP